MELIEDFRVILFILLEYFTIREYKTFDTHITRNSRRFVIKCIQNCDSLLSLRQQLTIKGCALDVNEYNFVKRFLDYLTFIEKNVK